MLRTLTKLAVPLSTRFCKFHFQRYIVDTNADWTYVNARPNLVQTLSQLKGRKMCTTVTDDMHLSHEEFVKLKENGKIVIIDVRNPAELQESGKIDGSINIPLKDLRFALEYLSIEEFQYKYGIPRPNLDAPLVFHCKSGGRSLQALQIALDLGYKNAKHYKEGFSGWIEHTAMKKN